MHDKRTLQTGGHLCEFIMDGEKGSITFIDLKTQERVVFNNYKDFQLFMNWIKLVNTLIETRVQNNN